MTPGQAELARHELELADQALRVAPLNLDAGAREDAVSRLYYAVFHAARGALVVRGLSAKTHSGLVDVFRRTYGAAPVVARLQDLRGKADYALEEFEREVGEIEGDIREASSFIERCRGIIEGALSRRPDEPDPPPDI